MICVGIDSSARSAAVAILQDGRLLCERYISMGLTQSESLLPLVDEALRSCSLTPADVHLYGICAGPGSFTGLRIGLAVVKGLAFVNQTPCAGVSTLAALAREHRGGSGTVVAALDARHREVFWAAFDGLTGQRLTEDAADKIENLEKFLENCKKPVFFVGDGADLCYNQFNRASGVVRPDVCLTAMRGVGVALAALDMQKAGLALPPAALLPRYLKLSQAERELALRQQSKQANGGNTAT